MTDDELRAEVKAWKSDHAYAIESNKFLLAENARLREENIRLITLVRERQRRRPAAGDAAGQDRAARRFVGRQVRP